VERWVFEKAADQKKKGETDSQFLYKNRKLAVGAFKEQLWNLPSGTREAIRGTLQRKFAFLFEMLRVTDTRDVVARYVTAELAKAPVAPAAAGQGAREGYVRDDEAGD
jgi:hypothetical protein